MAIGAFISFQGTTSSGGADASYIHNQDTANTIWDITHPLGKKPSVTCFNQIDIQMEGQIQYITNNRLIVSFNNSCAGKAYLN